MGTAPGNSVAAFADGTLALPGQWEGAFAAGPFTRVILKFLPVVLLVRRVLAHQSRGRYRFVEDSYLPPAFLKLMERFRLPLQPEGNFFLRDRRPLRAGVITERNPGRGPQDADIKRELRQWLEESGRTRREYALMTFSPRMYDRYGFHGERPCFLLVWTADRQPLEQLLRKREDRRALKTWKRNLLESPLAGRRALGDGGFRPPARIEWKQWEDLSYARLGRSDGAGYQKLSVQDDDEFYRMTLTAAPAATAEELADRVRRWKEHDNGAELAVCSLELQQRGRLKLWIDGFTPLIWRAKDAKLFLGIGSDGDAHMKQIRGKLQPGDRILIAPGGFGEEDRDELRAIFGQDRDEFARRMSAYLDRRGQGRGLFFEYHKNRLG